MTDGNTSQITNTHYSGGFQYTEDHLDFFPNAEGYVNVLDYSAFNYVYTYKDHLGNIRLKYTLDPDTNETAILEENHYYPYGLTHQGYNADHKFFFAINEIIELVEVTSIMDDKYKYKFNGFEYQEELGLGWYDYGSRNYQPDLGRWMNIDPLAEKYYDFSPYHTSANNPVVFMDYNGEDYIVTVNIEEQTATVSGTLYATGEDMAAAQTGADFWNDQSGDFTYTYKDGDGNSHSLTVNFDISVQEVTIGEGETKMGALNKALGEDNTGGGNVFVVVPDENLGDNVNGTTQTNFIQVKESMVNADTPAHEVGHALGVPHSNSSLMSEVQSSTNRTPSINTTDVKRSVKDAVRGRERNDGRGRSTLNFQGNVNLPNTAKDQRRFKRGKVERNE